MTKGNFIWVCVIFVMFGIWVGWLLAGGNQGIATSFIPAFGLASFLRGAKYGSFKVNKETGFLEQSFK